MGGDPGLAEPGGDRLPGQGGEVAERGETEPPERGDHVAPGQCGQVAAGQEGHVVGHDDGRGALLATGVGGRHPGGEGPVRDTEARPGGDAVELVTEQVEERALAAVVAGRPVDGDQHQPRLDDLDPGHVGLDHAHDRLETAGLLGPVALEDAGTGGE